MKALLKHTKKFALFALLPLAIFIVVLVVPFSQGVFLTFTNWDGFEWHKFVAFDNYVKSFQDPTFWSTLQFTGLFVIVSLILINVVAFGLALLVTAKLRSSNILEPSSSYQTSSVVWFSVSFGSSFSTVRFLQ
jgi:raffinose/stachyose/melibiose transport system permease protein